MSYACNVSPIDMTNIIQYFVTKGCAFLLPTNLDLAQAPFPVNWSQLEMKHVGIDQLNSFKICNNENGQQQ